MSYGGVDFNQSILNKASTLRKTGKLQSQNNEQPQTLKPAVGLPVNHESPQVKPKPKPVGKLSDKSNSSPLSQGASRVPSTNPTLNRPAVPMRESTHDVQSSAAIGGRPKGNSVMELSKKLMLGDSSSSGNNSPSNPSTSSLGTPKASPSAANMATSPSKAAAKPPPPVRKDSTKLTLTRTTPPPPANVEEPEEELYDDIQEYSAKVQAMKKAKMAASNPPSSQPPPNLMQQQQQQHQQQHPPPPSPLAAPPLPPPNIANNQPPPSSPAGPSHGGGSPIVKKSPSFETFSNSERRTADQHPNSNYSSHYNSSTLPSNSKSGKPFKRDNVASATNYKELEEPMGLAEFVNKYQSCFPTQMKMCSAHNNGAVAVNNGDIYNVHFLKNTDVVSLTASGGTQYFVPLNSAVEFGLVYNPTNSVQDALQGFVFATAGEIMSTGTMPPPLVCVQQNCEVSSQEGSVQAGDILVVNEVKSKLLRGKMLLCTDVRTEQKKRLPDTCTGNFSTTPSQVKLFLPQVLRHIPLPQYCVLYYNGYGADAQNIANKLPRGIVELTRTTTQQSLIVSKEYSDELFEFPITNNVTVQPIQPSETMARNLTADTNYKYESFNPATVQSMSLMLSIENPYTISKQVALLSVPRADKNSFIGVKLVKPGAEPSSIYASPSSPATTSNPPALPVFQPPNTSQPPPPPTPPMAPTSDNNDMNDDDDDPDYQLPCVALEEYNKIKNTMVSKPMSNTIPMRGGNGSNTPSSHYDRPRSSIGEGGTVPTSTVRGVVSSAASVTIPEDPINDGDDDIYDIPCPNETPPTNNKPSTNIKSASTKKPSIDHSAAALPPIRGTITGGPPPPPVTSIPSNPPLYGSNTTRLPSSQLLSSQQDNAVLQADVNRLKEETKTLKTTVEKLESMFDGLASSIASLQSEVRSIKSSSMDNIPDTPEANISLLQSLSCDQVLHLIKEMNLTEYYSIFLKEQIDGSLLCECDDEVLQDLGVNLKLHRMKLSSVIAGKVSIKQLLEKDPYVKCFK